MNDGVWWESEQILIGKMKASLSIVSDFMFSIESSNKEYLINSYQLLY